MATTIVLIGDTHVPERAEKIPEQFVEEINQADIVMCTGDITDENVMEKMMEEADEFHVVRGEEDYLELPEQDLVNIEGLTFGLIHGHQFDEGDVVGDTKPGIEDEEEGEKGMMEKITEYGKLMNVNILVTGHTHSPFRAEKEGVIMFNPGTATGAKKEGETGKRTCIRIKMEEGKLVDSEIIQI